MARTWLQANRELRGEATVTWREPVYFLASSMTIPADHNALERIRAEYLEMPGMSLTLEQVQRLCGIERSTCRMVLDSLVAMKFLYLKADGAYARLTAESSPRPQPAKAHLTVASATVCRAS